MKILSDIRALKPIIIVPLAFLLPLKLVVNYSEGYEKQSKCAYAIIVMAVLWLTEAIPIPVTALIPIFLFPMLGVATAKEISGSYVTDTTMLFLGGLIIAVALEESGLHVRISLGVMLIVGANPIWIMFGMMTTTWFLSMWISNTAATAMMIPIIGAVIDTTKNVHNTSESDKTAEGLDMVSIQKENTDEKTNDINKEQQNGNVQERDSSSQYNITEKQTDHEKITDEQLVRQAKGFALSVAYGANIGGIATLTGTPPNLVMKNFADELYGKYNQDPGITFAKWMGFAFPMAMLTAVLAWLWLALVFLRCSCFKKMDPVSKKAINDTIRMKFKKLGKLSFCEAEILVVFVALVLLWLFRSPPNLTGWGNAFKPGMVSDSTPCILISVLLFILPVERPNVFCWTKIGTLPNYRPILTWQIVVQKLSWGIIVLLGGGFAIALASQESGLSNLMGNNLKAFAKLDMWLMNLLICIIVAGATEVTSNTATATLLMPILSDMALATEINPLYLMISACISCSFAYMLPVATPPNAIVFSTGYLSIPDMALAGLPMNFIAVFCLTLAINTWGNSMYGLDTFPDYFRQGNKTTLAP